MSVTRFPFLAALLLTLALPAAMQAQFGGFGKMINKTKAARAKVDSAKATVDTARTLVDSTKTAVGDVTGQTSTARGSSGDTSAANANGISAKTNRTQGGAATPAATTSGSSPTTTTGASSSKKSATTGRTPRHPSTNSTPLSITETVYGQFARGYSAEQAKYKQNSSDIQGSVNAGVQASGLSQADYASVLSRVMLYGAYANTNQSNTLAPRMMTTDELAVLDGHKSDILQMLGAGAGGRNQK